MSKKSSKEAPRKEPTKEELVQKAKDAKVKSVAEQIQAILEANDMALQPFFNPMEFQFGIIPRVKLVEVPKPKEIDKATDTGETSGAKDTEGTTESQPTEGA